MDTPAPPWRTQRAMVVVAAGYARITDADGFIFGAETALIGQDRLTIGCVAIRSETGSSLRGDSTSATAFSKLACGRVVAGHRPGSGLTGSTLADGGAGGAHPERRGGYGRTRRRSGAALVREWRGERGANGGGSGGGAGAGECKTDATCIRFDGTHSACDDGSGRRYQRRQQTMAMVRTMAAHQAVAASGTGPGGAPTNSFSFFKWRLRRRAAAPRSPERVRAPRRHRARAQRGHLDESGSLSAAARRQARARAVISTRAEQGSSGAPRPGAIGKRHTR